MSYKQIAPNVSEIKTGTPAIKIGDKYVVGGIGGNFIPGGLISTGGVNTSDATATEADILYGKTAYVANGKVTGTIGASNPTVTENDVTIPKGYIEEERTITVGNAVNGSQIRPSTTEQTINAGSFLLGDVVIEGSESLVAKNISAGESIFGVSGTFTSDATATASDIAKDKTAYVNGEKIVGTATGGGGAVEFYKCSSTDVSANTWSGYKAAMSNGIYTFEESVTEGLTFGNGYTPAPGFIYNSDATMLISNMWGGLPLPADYDIYATFATPAAEKGGLFTMERSSVDYGVTKNGVTGAEFNGGIVSIPWDMTDDFTFSVRYKPLDVGESSYHGPLVRVGNDGSDSLYSMWFNMEWGLCMMRLEYGSGGTETVEVDANAHVYTLVKSGDELKIYIDRDLLTSDNHICNVQDRSHIYVGGMGGYYHANGHYSNLRIYSRALTSEEIANIVQQAANN